MSNFMLGFPNLIDSTTLSGGSYVSSLPRDNIKDRIIKKVARTSNLLAASTLVVIDCGKSVVSQAFAVLNHNFSLDATYRLRGSNASDFSTTVYDTGVKEVWPQVYPYGTLEFEDDNWWDGKYTASQIKGYTTALIDIASALVYARYWKFEVFDTTNTDGYVQFGRIFMGRVWQPSLNMVYGASLGWETKTDVQEALSGTEYFQERPMFRSQKFSIDLLTEDEAFAQAFEIMRQAGVSKELLFIHDPADTVHALRRRFLGRFRQLSPIEYPVFQRNKVAFEIKELI